MPHAHFIHKTISCWKTGKQTSTASEQPQTLWIGFHQLRQTTSFLPPETDIEPPNHRRNTIEEIHIGSATWMLSHRSGYWVAEALVDVPKAFEKLNARARPVRVTICFLYIRVADQLPVQTLRTSRCCFHPLLHHKTSGEIG